MKHIIEYQNYFVNLDLDDYTKSRIYNWLEKNQDEANEPGRIEDLVNSIMTDLNISKDKKDGVRNIISSEYSLHDELSMIMSPYPEFIYTNNPDQVQNLYY